MKRIIGWLVMLGVLLFIHPPGWGQYKISHDVIGNGGTESSDGTNILLGTIGQPSIGVIDTIPYRNDVGYWYQLGYVITGVTTKQSKLPKVYSLDQNYPNPFNPSTTIQFALPEETHVTLRIYDVLGRLVATVINEEMMPGVYRATFDAKNLASGVYFYRIHTKGFVKSKKLVVIN